MKLTSGWDQELAFWPLTPAQRPKSTSP